MKSITLTHRLLKPLLLVLLLWAPLLPGQAQVFAQAVDVPQEETPRISQRQALELVRARFPGNVVSINQVQLNEALQYRVRMDNEGSIYTVYVNADTGVITREQ